MAYSDKAKRLRRCKKVKADGTQCRAYARINGQYCCLHGYDHKTKKLPKKNEREAAKIRRAKKRAQTQPHQTCDCSAYGWRHRAGSGVCKFPDPPSPEIDNDDEMEHFQPRDEMNSGSSVIGSGLGSTIEDDLPPLDSEQVPQDREERERWNRKKLRQLIEKEALNQRQASDDFWHY